MAENSAFWDGEVTGDAASVSGWEAPYLDTEKVDILAKLVSSNDVSGYVVPEYEGELRVAEATTPDMTVVVSQGVAMVRGRLYENTTTASLTIAANASGSPRIDRIILRTSFAAQTIRLAVLQGTPGASPALPTLTQDANTWEVSLAYIWVANGESVIENENIHDERQFTLSFSAINKSCGLNKILNSEFLAIGYDQPANWTWNMLGSVVSDTAPPQMSRGRAIKLTATEISQTFPVTSNTTYSIKVLVKVNPGDTCNLLAYTNSLNGGTEQANKLINRTEEWIDYTIYLKTDHDSYEMTFEIQTTGIAYCGQVIIVEGYYPGNYRQISELLFPNGDPDSPYGFGYLVDTYSTETVVWDMDTSDPNLFGSILEGTKTIFLSSRVVRDTYFLDPTTYDVKYRAYNGTTILGAFTPMNIRYMNNTVQIEIPLIDRKFEADYTAVGVDTLNVEYIVTGMRT